jgi:hypothetical protein
MDQRTTITPVPVPSLVRDANARMALWANVLPGWCNQDDTFAGALQAALGIRLADEEIDKEDDLIRIALFWLVDDRYFEDVEDTKRRFRYRPRLIISQSDRDAAALVVTRAVTVLTLAAIRKGRWRATIGDDFLTDWTIVKRVLIKHQSFRDFAKELGLDERAIRQRFHSAIEAIAAAIGPVQWPKSLSPHPRTYSRGPRERMGRRPQWRDQLHVHVDRPDFQGRDQVLASELDLVARFLADGGAVQKLPPGLAVDFDTVDVKGHPIGHVSGIDTNHIVTTLKQCACYGPDGELLWVVSSRPQAAWDNVVPSASRYHDADLDVEPKWQGKAHADFEKKYLRGQQWLDPWQSRQTQRFAVKFYNASEDGLLPGRLNGAERRGRPNRDCTGPDWEYQGVFVTMREPPRQREVYAPGWDEGPIPKRAVLGVEPSDVINDTIDLLVRWSPPSSYFNLTPEEINTPFFND